MLNWWRLPLNTVSSLSCRSDLTVLTLLLINQTTSLSSSSRTKLTDYFYLEPDNSSAGSFCSTVSLFARGNTKSTHWVNRGDSKNGSVSFILYVMFVSHIYFIFNMNKWVIHFVCRLHTETTTWSCQRFLFSLTCVLLKTGWINRNI